MVFGADRVNVFPLMAVSYTHLDVYKRQGYIGSHTVYALCEAGREVVVVDNLETGHAEAVHPDAKFYKGDISDKPFLNDVFQKENIEAVIHFAAYSLVGESVENPLKYYENNLSKTRDMLEVMVANGVDKFCLLYTSGYDEPNYFGYVFKKKFGVSPNKFRGK